MRSKLDEQAGKVPGGQLAPGLAALAAAVLLMKNSSLAAEAVGQGLALCAGTMIPSLFPFMVIAELIVRSGTGRTALRPVARLLKPIFGVSEAGGCALALGALCGFPVGARTAAAYYRSGEMDVREFNHVLCFGNVPSSAFLIGAVGCSLFGDARIGRAMLALTLMAAALVGLLLRFLMPRRIVTASKQSSAPLAAGSRGGSLLSDAIASAAGAMQGVCATVVVFSAVIGILGRYADAIGLSESVRTALLGLLELSTGVAQAASLADVRAAVVLCAGMAGWAGLSVHCQILSVCDGCPVALGPFWLSRALQGLACGGGMWLALRFGWLDVQGVVQGASVHTWTTESVGGRVWQALCTAAFLAASAVWLTGRGRGGESK